MNDFELRITKLKPIPAYQIVDHYSTLFGLSIVSMLMKMGYAPNDTYNFDHKKASARFKYSDAKQYTGVFYCLTAYKDGFEIDGKIYQIGLVYWDEWIDGSKAENAYMVLNGGSVSMNTLSAIYNYLRMELNHRKKTS